MRSNNYLSLLFLIYILPPEIVTLTEENTRNSSNLYIRKKRIIDPKDTGPMDIKDYPYVVNILKLDRHCCGGSIVHSRYILTAAQCVEDRNTSIYAILSGSSLVNKGTRHIVKHIESHKNYSTRTQRNDLAMLKIFPAIDIGINNSPNQIISLSDEPERYCQAFTLGWGHVMIRIVPAEGLHVILVPILNWRECQDIYRRKPGCISELEICVFDTAHKRRSSNGDGGNPLIVHDGLAGVLSWRGERNGKHYPDVFINVAHPLYRSWINSIIAAN